MQLAIVILELQDLKCIHLCYLITYKEVRVPKAKQQAGPRKVALSGGKLDPGFLCGKHFRLFLNALAFWGTVSKNIPERVGAILGQYVGPDF